jgi:hypothetical protein
VHGLPVAFALANPKADEREVLVSSFDVEPALLAERPGQLLIVDKAIGTPRPRRCWPPVGCGCCARRLPTSRLAPVAGS